MSAPPSLSRSLAALALPRTRPSAERLVTRTVLVLRRSLEIATCRAVVLRTTLRSQASTFRHGQLLAATDRKVGIAASHQRPFLGFNLFGPPFAPPLPPFVEERFIGSMPALLAIFFIGLPLP